MKKGSKDAASSGASLCPTISTLEKSSLNEKCGEKILENFDWNKFSQNILEKKFWKKNFEKKKGWKKNFEKKMLEKKLKKKKFWKKNWEKKFSNKIFKKI